MNKEALFDRNTEVQKSDINLETGNLNGNLGLDGWVLESLYSDFIFVEYIDIDHGFQTSAGGIVKMSTTNKVWRKGIVRMVSDFVASRGRTKVGDAVLFPSDKGLQTGFVYYRDEKGKRKKSGEGVFLNEARLFSTISEAKEK